MTSVLNTSSVDQEQTVSRAFRIKKSDLDILEKEAGDQNSSVNLLVNDLIARHVHFGRTAKKYHPMWMSAGALRLFIEDTADEKILKIAEEVANTVPDLSYELTGDKSPAGILESLKILCKYSDANEYAEEDFGDKKVIILMHGVGRKFSIFQAEHWKRKFAHAGAEVSTSFSDNCVVFELRSSDLNPK